MENFIKSKKELDEILSGYYKKQTTKQKERNNNMKKKKLLEELIETQKEININIKDLNEALKPKIETIAMSADTINGWTGIINNLETNVYNKEQTIDAVNKEYDYRKNYEKCENENIDLLQLIEQYCKYNDKYEVIDIFKELNKKYEIKLRKEKK